MDDRAACQRLAEWMVRFADTLVSDYDLDGLLTDLCNAGVELFEAASATVLASADADAEHLDTLAASDPANAVLAENERRTGRGPGAESFQAGQVVDEADLLARGRRRWPTFTETADDLGHRAVLAVPLRVGDRRIGAMELLWNEPRALVASDRALCQSLADVASIGIANAHRIDQLTTLNEQLQRALDSRVVIEQAKGVLAATHEIMVDEAFTLMRAHARASGSKLNHVARRIVDGELTL